MKKLIVALAIASSVGFGASAYAAPINCPASQVAVHDGGDQWSCENRGGNTNESDSEKQGNHPN